MRHRCPTFCLLMAAAVSIFASAQRNPSWPWVSDSPGFAKLSGAGRKDADRSLQEIVADVNRHKPCALPPDKPYKPLHIVVSLNPYEESEFLEPWPPVESRNLRPANMEKVESVDILFPQRRRWGASHSKNNPYGRPLKVWGPEENYARSAEKKLSIVNGEIALSECVNGTMTEATGVFPPVSRDADAYPPKGVIPQCEGTCRFLGPVMHDQSRRFVLLHHGRLNQLWWIVFTEEPGLAGVLRVDKPCGFVNPKPIPFDFEFRTYENPPQDTLPGLRWQGWLTTCFMGDESREYTLEAILPQMLR